MKDLKLDEKFCTAIFVFETMKSIKTINYVKLYNYIKLYLFLYLTEYIANCYQAQQSFY